MELVFHLEICNNLTDNDYEEKTNLLKILFIMICKDNQNLSWNMMKIGNFRTNIYNMSLAYHDLPFFNNSEWFESEINISQTQKVSGSLFHHTRIGQV